MKGKECSKCKITKSKAFFHKDKGQKDGYYPWCKACKKEYDTAYRITDKVIDYYKSEEYKESKKEYRRRNFKKLIVRAAKSRAVGSNIEFNIKEEDIELVKFCPFLEIELDYSGDRRINWNSPSLDRIDNSKGYIPGNVWIISRRANTMKHSANREELKIFSKNCLKLIKNGTII